MAMGSSCYRVKVDGFELELEDLISTFTDFDAATSINKRGIGVEQALYGMTDSPRSF